MTALGDAAETANALRRTHLRLHRPLAAGIILCLVLVWFLLNGGSMTPNAYLSGNLRIITGASMLALFLGGLWLLRDFLTRQLEISSLRLPLNLQILGWGLVIVPFLRTVLLARITPLNELMMTEYVLLHHRLFQISEFITTASSLLICAGLILMAYRLSRVKATLYGFEWLLRWLTFFGGLIFTYAFTNPLMNLFGINFVVMSAAPDATTRIGLTSRFQLMENILWLSNGINWIDGLAVAAWAWQVVMLGLLAVMFFRIYLHSAYWLRQTAER